MGIHAPIEKLKKPQQGNIHLNSYIPPTPTVNVQFFFCTQEKMSEPEDRVAVLLCSGYYDKVPETGRLRETPASCGFRDWEVQDQGSGRSGV